MGRFHRHDDGTAHEHDGDGTADAHAHHSDGTAHGHHGDGAGHSHHGDGDGNRSDDTHSRDAQEAPGGAGAGLLSGALDHSGYQTGAERVEVLEAIFGENDKKAAANRAQFAAAGVRAVNLMSSPGAGKTALLRETLSRLAGQLRIGVIEGDIETSLDADRLAGFGAAIALINTGNGFGGECHLDAPMVASALSRLPLPELDLVLIENVGNLVCPAEFDVGQDARAMVYAITEGEEKPLKYPVMFRSCELIVVNKMDLLPYLDFDVVGFLDNLRKVNPAAEVIFASARTGKGVDQWCDWLRARL